MANAPLTVPLVAVNTAAFVASEAGKVIDVAATDIPLSVLALKAFAWIRLPETVAVEPVPSVVAVKPVEAVVAAVTALPASLSCCDAIAMPTPTVVPERPIALAAVLPVAFAFCVLPVRSNAELVVAPPTVSAIVEPVVLAIVDVKVVV